MSGEIAVFYSHPNSTDFLFPKHSESLDKKLEARNKPGNAYKQFWHINEQILFNLKALASLDTEEEEFKPSLLSNTISMALTYINRIIRKYEPQTVNSRIIIVSVSPDIPSQYITIMNNIFCAQRLMIKMDICKLLNEDSVFLQQAAYLTSGVYVKVEYPERLIHYLMHSFLPNSSMRETLALRSGDQVDFRAACFCHKKIVDVGFVCSVCLSSKEFIY
ncbi:RNA polymerase II transcription factor B subunit 4 [Lobulomyces angularis]|nr:RNA polymerase II transcription factor B subunit 4 [Lobulomyces angularis]